MATGAKVRDDGGELPGSGPGQEWRVLSGRASSKYLEKKIRRHEELAVLDSKDAHQGDDEDRGAARLAHQRAQSKLMSAGRSGHDKDERSS